jgi:hypothetical protein
MGNAYSTFRLVEIPVTLLRSVHPNGFNGGHCKFLTPKELHGSNVER